MRYLANLGIVVGMVLGTSGTLKAQYQAVPGAAIGAPTAYRYAYPNHYYYGYATANPGPVAAPAGRYHPVNPYGYVNRPYYGAFGYGNYSNGSTDGFPPFRGRRSR